MASTSNPSAGPATSGATASAAPTAPAATQPTAAAHEAVRPTSPRRPAGPTLTLGELAGLVGVIAVAAVATSSLALAQLGRHDGVAAIVAGVLVTGVLTAVGLAVGGRPRIVVDVVELGLLAAILAAGLWLFLPGAPYAATDKDPGIYVAHAVAIARDGDTVIDDEIVARGIEPEHDVGGRFPGIWEASDNQTQVTSQFYHLYSATLATADDLGGRSALFNLTPVLAAAAVAVLAIGARRAFGTLVAMLMAAFLITSAMQLWQAKYPSTEILAQLFLAGALLGAVLAVTQRWAGGALASGLLIGAGFLTRPDGVLYLVLGAAALAVAIVAPRAGLALDPRVDRRAAAFAGGLALTLPYAFYNAYVVRDEYTRINDVPGPLALTAAIALIVAAGAAARWALGRAGRVQPEQPDRSDVVERLVARWQRPVGLLVVLALGGVMLVLYNRETLFGQDFAASRFAGGESVRTYAEMNMVWLSWFFSRAGLVILWLGMCVLALRKWQAPRLLFVLPGLALLPVYAYDARVSMRLMWWVRRFIPAVLPILVLLLALAIAWALTRRNWGLRAVGAIALVVMLLRFTDASLPLRNHREMDGSWELAAAIAEQTPDEQAVYLYPQPERGVYDPIAITPGAVWWIFDQMAARLPDDYDLSTIEQYQEAFPDNPVLLVSDGDDLPAHLPADRFERTGVIVDDLVVLEETLDRRPEEVQTLTWEVSVWRLTESAT